MRCGHSLASACVTFDSVSRRCVGFNADETARNRFEPRADEDTVDSNELLRWVLHGNEDAGKQNGVAKLPLTSGDI